MNTQTFAQDQAFTAITEEELMAVNGGGAGATLGWIFGNIPTLGIPLIADAFTGGKITKAAADY